MQLERLGRPQEVSGALGIERPRDVLWWLSYPNESASLLMHHFHTRGTGIIRLMRLKLPKMSASIDRFRLCLFGFAPSREALLLAPIVRVSFQFVVLAGVAVEENDLLRMF